MSSCLQYKAPPQIRPVASDVAHVAVQSQQTAILRKSSTAPGRHRLLRDLPTNANKAGKFLEILGSLVP